MQLQFLRRNAEAVQCFKNGKILHWVVLFWLYLIYGEKQFCLFRATLYYLCFCIPKIQQILKYFPRTLQKNVLVNLPYFWNTKTQVVVLSSMKETNMFFLSSFFFRQNGWNFNFWNTVKEAAAWQMHFLTFHVTLSYWWKGKSDSEFILRGEVTALFCFSSARELQNKKVQKSAIFGGKLNVKVSDQFL